MRPGAGTGPIYLQSPPMMTGGTGAPGAGGQAGTLTAPPTLVAGVASAVLMNCIVLAGEIVAAGDRVVANHVRCQRIARRIALMTLMLRRLQEGLQRNEVEHQRVEPLMEQIHGVMSDALAVIKKWEGKGDGTLELLKEHEGEFVDLNERLSCAYSDLLLVLHVEQSLEQSQFIKDMRGDTLKDLQGMAKEMATKSQLWTRLTSDEQRKLVASYKAHGLDLVSLMEEIKMMTRQQYIDSRIRDLLIDKKEFSFHKVIGRGGFGEVHLATRHRQKVAVKMLLVGPRTVRVEHAIKREAYIMTQLRHPNVALCYGLVMEEDVMALVLAYYPGGTLTHVLQDDLRDLPVKDKWQIALDVAEGMNYLHSRPFEPVIHGDLKAGNLLLDAEGNVVMADFGLSRIQSLTTTAAPSGHDSALSIVYAAPEILSNPSHRKSPATDVYAYGMLLYEVFTREPPFLGAVPAVLMAQVTQGLRPVIPDDVPTQVAQLIAACWAQQPAARPAFDEILATLKSMNL